MIQPAEATIHLPPKVYRAAKAVAAASNRSVSRVIRDAVLRALEEDAEDLAAIQSRKGQPTRPYEEVRKSLRRDGLL